MYVNQLQGNAFFEGFFVGFRFLTDFAGPEVFFRVGVRVGVFFLVANRICPCPLRQAESLTESCSNIIRPNVASMVSLKTSLFQQGPCELVPKAHGKGTKPGRPSVQDPVGARHACPELAEEAGPLPSSGPGVRVRCISTGFRYNIQTRCLLVSPGTKLNRQRMCLL